MRRALRSRSTPQAADLALWHYALESLQHQARLRAVVSIFVGLGSVALLGALAAMAADRSTTLLSMAGVVLLVTVGGASLHVRTERAAGRLLEVLDAPAPPLRGER